MKKRMLDVLMLVIGAFFFALAVNLFAIPNDLGKAESLDYADIVLSVSMVSWCHELYLKCVFAFNRLQVS